MKGVTPFMCQASLDASVRETPKKRPWQTSKRPLSYTWSRWRTTSPYHLTPKCWKSQYDKGAKFRVRKGKKSLANGTDGWLYARKEVIFGFRSIYKMRFLNWPFLHIAQSKDPRYLIYWNKLGFQSIDFLSWHKNITARQVLIWLHKGCLWVAIAVMEIILIVLERLSSNYFIVPLICANLCPINSFSLCPSACPVAPGNGTGVAITIFILCLPCPPNGMLFFHYSIGVECIWSYYSTGAISVCPVKYEVHLTGAVKKISCKSCLNCGMVIYCKQIQVLSLPNLLTIFERAAGLI